MSNDPFQTLVNLLYQKKQDEQQEESCTLVLGPGLSFTTELQQKIAQKVEKDCTNWGEFYDHVETMSKEDYRKLLQEYFDEPPLRNDYQDLAQLILDGYFRAVFTMNTDMLLKAAIDHAITKAELDASQVVNYLIRGHKSDREIATELKKELSTEPHTVCWLRGHINNNSKFYGRLAEIINFSPLLESEVKRYLKRNVLLVGYIRDADLDISRCLSKQGDAIWYVSPPESEPRPTDLSPERCRGREISCTDEAEFNTFFCSLKQALEGEDLMNKSKPQRDFFISYNSHDRERAEWIAWQLEQAGYSVYIQAWDILPGSNFVLAMHEAASRSKRTIAVLSDNYLNARFTQSEWAAAFVQDPEGKKGKLLPVRISECNPRGILQAIVYIDLVKLDEAAAREKLLDSIGGVRQGRNKPGTPPAFWN